MRTDRAGPSNPLSLNGVWDLCVRDINNFYGFWIQNIAGCSFTPNFESAVSRSIRKVQWILNS